MGRIGRSFQLVRQSFVLLMHDKELMVLPLLSGIIIAAIVGAVSIGSGLSEDRVRAGETTAYAVLFGMFVVAYTVGIFFQAAVIAGATQRMRGGDPTVGSALAAASRRIGPILIWAVVAATVGLVLKIIEDKAGFIGRIVVRLIGVAWSLATLFVVPALVLEDLSVRESFDRSIGTFRKTWGESVVGNINFTAASIVAWFTLIALTGLVGWAGAGVWSMALFVPGAMFLMVLFSTLQGVFVASLYRYATAGEAAGFDRQLVAGAFGQKR